MLVNEVVPCLRHAARTIPKVGHDDDEEIVQEATLMAARMMDSAEKAVQRFSAGNMAWYAAKAAAANTPECKWRQWRIGSSWPVN